MWWWLVTRCIRSQMAIMDRSSAWSSCMCFICIYFHCLLTPISLFLYRQLIPHSLKISHSPLTLRPLSMTGSPCYAMRYASTGLIGLKSTVQDNDVFSMKLPKTYPINTIQQALHRAPLHRPHLLLCNHHHLRHPCQLLQSPFNSPSTNSSFTAPPPPTPPQNLVQASSLVAPPHPPTTSPQPKHVTIVLSDDSDHLDSTAFNIPKTLPATINQSEWDLLIESGKMLGWCKAQQKALQEQVHMYICSSNTLIQLLFSAKTAFCPASSA